MFRSSRRLVRPTYTAWKQSSSGSSFSTVKMSGTKTSSGVPKSTVSKKTSDVSTSYPSHTPQTSTSSSYVDSLLSSLKVRGRMGRSMSMSDIDMSLSRFKMPSHTSSKPLHWAFGLRSMPLFNPKLVSLLPTSSKSIREMSHSDKTEMVKNVFSQTSTDMSQVLSGIKEEDGAHQYTHLGKQSSINHKALETLTRLYDSGSKEEIGQMFLDAFPGVAKSIKPAPDGSGQFLVQLTSGAVIKAKIEKFDLGDGKFGFGLQAHTTSKHPLRGVAQWMLCVDPENAKASFSVVGAGKHRLESMDQMNNQLIDCGFWDATGDGLISQLNGEPLDDKGRYHMFKLANLPNTMMGPLNSFVPSDPDEVA